jgi:peptidoglycan/xylan/chitin deacetylase (PgdA/CDA1 family)
MDKIKNLVKNTLYYSGYYHLVSSWRGLVHPEGKLIILAYHNISDWREDSNGPLYPFNLKAEIAIQQFELQLTILKKLYKVVSLEEGVKFLKKGKEFKDKLVAITFDDGYESFYTLALPLLKKYDVPATVFLPTDFVNSQGTFWWDELHQVISYAVPSGECASALISVIGEKLAKQFSEVGKDFRQKKQFLESLEFYLRNIEDGQKQEKIKNLEELLLKGSHPKPSVLRTLNWDQIVEMSKAGISFGSHTCSHLNLKFVSLEVAREELAKSKEVIEDNIKARVACFAYPYEVDFETHLRIRPILESLKYECACASWGEVNLSDLDPFFLKRVTLPMTTFSPLIARELLLC